MNKPTHAVIRRTKFQRTSGPTEEISYLASGTIDECASLVEIFEDRRTAFGGAPGKDIIEEIRPMSAVPVWAAPAVLAKSAAAADEANRETFPTRLQRKSRQQLCA